MKALLFISTLVLFGLGIIACSTQSEVSNEKKITTGDNTMTSVDWDGTYFGILPCADCEGIGTLLKLNSDLSYELKIKYLGKDDNLFESRGSFGWNEHGNKITLSGSDGGSKHFFVGENFIRQLDVDGNQITGNLAEKYVLRKSLPEIINKYWKLMELRGKKVQHNQKNNREPHMVLKTDGNKVHGSGGCNTFNGSYDLMEGNRITFSKLATTLMACENMETEQEFFKVLEMADNYFISADTLVLNKAKMAPLARFEAVYLR